MYNIALVILGVALFLYSLYLHVRFLSLVRKTSLEKWWVMLLVLVAFFTLGYIVFAYWLVKGAEIISIDSLKTLVSFIFFFGAIFVVVSITLIYSTVKDLIKKRAEIQRLQTDRIAFLQNKRAESEEKFSMLFEYAPDAYSIHDKEGNFIDVNKAFEKLLGYMEKEVIGKSFSELKLLSESGISKTFSDTVGGVLGKSAGTGEFTLNRKDGSKIIAETKAIPIKIKDETVMLVIERDITLRKKIEEALRESEEKFRSVIESSQDCIKVLDKNGRILLINKAGMEEHGFKTLEEALNNWNYLETIEEKYIPKIKEALKQALKDTIISLDVKHKQGKNIIGLANREWCNMTFSPLKGKQGKILNILAVSRDISESKKMEEELRKEKESVERKVTERTRELKEEQAKLVASINSLTIGFLLLDLKDNILLKNSAVSRILGIPESEVTIDRIRKYFKGIVDLETCHDQCIIEKKTIGVKDVAKGNKSLSLLLTPVIMLKDSEEVIGHILLIEDITEQKLIDKMRTEIVSTTSHQLRTPLSVVKGNLEMLLAGDFGKIGKEQKKILEEVFLGNERMIKLVNGLMDVSKITEGKFELKLSPEKLEELVAESVKELAPFAEKNNASLSYTPPSNPLPKVNIDSGRIKQLLQNLIENAIKYRRPAIKGKVLVEIRKDKTGKFLETSVKDNGAGIPKAEQKKVFERFFRASNIIRMDPGSGAGPGGGTGLGLYIAQAVIEQSGGKLWFESEGEDKGTTFYFRLPIKK